MSVKKKKQANKKEETTSTDSGSVFEDSPIDDTVEVEVEVEDKTSTDAMMSVADVESLLKRNEERMMSIFDSKLQKLKLSKAKAELEEDASYIEDLEEDWLEVPAVFFAYSINFSIHGDNNRGKSTEPPQGPVRFKPIIRSKRQTRKGEEVISVSSVKVHSKAVAKWLREHSHFGIAFFENMESALSIDSGWAQKLIEANQSIQRLSDQQVIARCRQQGMPIGTDVVKMRKALVESTAERSIKRHDDIQYGKLRKSVIDNNDRQVVEKTVPQ